MCHFLSAIVNRQGDIFWSPYLDSHEEILQALDLRENLNELCRVEYTTETLCELDTYKLKVDETREPDWFDEVRECVERKLHQIVKRMFVTGKRLWLVGDCWILKNADVRTLGCCRIIAAKDSIVGDAGNATIVDAGNTFIVFAGRSTIKFADTATIQYAGQAAIQNANEATINYANEVIIQNAGRATIKNANHATIQNANRATIQNANTATIFRANAATIVNRGDATISDTNNDPF